jgi:hypothetical protein
MEAWLEKLKNLAFPGIDPENIATLSRSSRSTVLQHDLLVAKCHIASDNKSLSKKIHTIQESDFQSIFLQPNRFISHHQNDDINISYWPEAERISPDKLTDGLWSEIGSLLARLHSVPLKNSSLRFPAELFPIFSEVNEKIESCFKKSAGSSKYREHLETINHAWISILTNKNFHKVVKDIRLRPKVWSHGDFHLGQIVIIQDQGKNAARLIDCDSLCHSIAEWDLARPAALFAAGILPAQFWQSFIESYAEHRFKCKLNEKKLWSSLDIPAKVMTVKLATNAVNRATLTDDYLEDSELELIETCKAISHDC